METVIEYSSESNSPTSVECDSFEETLIRKWNVAMENGVFRFSENSIQYSWMVSGVLYLCSVHFAFLFLIISSVL